MTETTTKHPVQAAMPVAAKVLDLLRPWTTRAEIAGSIRRLRPTVKDIEIVAVPIDVPLDLFGKETRPASAEIREIAADWGRLVKGGEKYIQVADVFGSGMTVDLFLVTPPAEWGPIFAIRTGPADFSQMLVTRIKGRLWRCAEGHVVDEKGEPVPCPTEADFFAAARVDYLPPEAR